MPSLLIFIYTYDSFILHTFFLDNDEVLAQKDLEWCKANYPAEFDVIVEKSEPPRKKVARKKVRES